MSSFLQIFKSIIKEGQDGLGDHRTPGWIELWSPNGGQDGLCDRQAPRLGGALRPLRPLHPSCTRSASVLRLGPRAPTCFLVSVFSLPPSALEAAGHPLNERSKMLRPVQLLPSHPALIACARWRCSPSDGRRALRYMRCCCMCPARTLGRTLGKCTL